MRRLRTRLALVGSLVAFVGVAVASDGPVSGAPAIPPGFVDETVANVPRPTVIAFLPDGRALVASQPGPLRLLRDTTLLAAPALDLSSVTCSESERGVLGVAVDPQFLTSGHIYVFYTRRNGSACENRLSRFTMIGDQANSGSELVLLDRIASPAGNHNGGDVHVGNDGNLYVGVGDGGCDYAADSGCAAQNDAARDPHTLLGKIVRITRAGAVPPGNPFTGADTDRCNLTGGTTRGRRCAEVYATGLRNPFRLAFDPTASDTRFFINDVGQNVWEEINLGAAGADYGWNQREGRCATGSTTNCPPPPAGFTDPIATYGRGAGCASITGGAFVPPGAWPPEFEGSYLFADYVCGTIFRRAPDGTVTPFVTGLGGSSAVELDFGPSPTGPALWYTTYAGGGSIHRIRRSDANRAPTVALKVNPQAGSTPLRVTIDARGSADADLDPLTYLVDPGDGTGVIQSTNPVVVHTYTTAGRFVVTVVARDGRGGQSPAANLRVWPGNEPADVSITSPPASARFAVGETVTLTAAGVDPESGALPPSAYTWIIKRVHVAHTHPFLNRSGTATVSFAFPEPEDLAAAANSYLSVALVARDPQGAPTLTYRSLRPLKVPLTIDTLPSGLTATIEEMTITAPTTVTSWAGLRVTIEAPSPQGSHTFIRWSDGGAATHEVVTPTSPLTLTATFS